MSIKHTTVPQSASPRYRVIRGTEGVVRVDIQKAQEAMRHAMEVREHLRSQDIERNKFIRSHAAE